MTEISTVSYIDSAALGRARDDDRVTTTFDCEIQARFRDINLGGHVDNVEAIRVLDEARIQFFRFAHLPELDELPEPPEPPELPGTGLLRAMPPGVTELVGAQRIDYRAEMRFAPYQPFLVRLWVSRIGTSSFAVSSEMRVAADHPPAVLADTTLVFWDQTTQAAWPASSRMREVLGRYEGAPVALRG